MDYGKTTRCCQRATAEELKADPGRYDCTRCALKAQTQQLWRVNADAWRIYRLLCSRFVALSTLRGPLFERLTEGWPAEDVIDLVQRLDVIVNLLEPETK